jgi:NAD-dependent DNA ligase
MRFYTIKLDRPSWVNDPATHRQLKLLSFFRQPVRPSLTKGTASGMIARLFKDEENKILWEKYVYLTGDEGRETSELSPFDWNELRALIIPESWRPARSEGISSGRKERLRGLIAEALRDGTPFDDPVPEIQIGRRYFAFTGIFSSGTRPECLAAVDNLSGIGQNGVTGSTDYLVIGNEASDRWAEGSHGRKIEKAMILRMETGKPAIISEADWTAALQKQN